MIVKGLIIDSKILELLDTNLSIRMFALTPIFKGFTIDPKAFKTIEY